MLLSSAKGGNGVGGGLRLLDRDVQRAGDAFGAGFLYGRVNGWDWYRSARLGNACGAIVVTKHGCANFMPTLPEVESFVAPFGGLD